MRQLIGYYDNRRIFLLQKFENFCVLGQLMKESRWNWNLFPITPVLARILSTNQEWAQGSFVEAEAKVEAEARQCSNVLNRGEARQKQRARGQGEAD